MNHPKPKTRLYVEAALHQGALITLGKEQSHYLLNVMRQPAGALVALFNGRDGEWWGEMQLAGSKKAAILLQTQHKPQPNLPELWLYFAPIKFGRIDYLIQKATELGVSRLIPTRTARTIVDRVNLDRLRAHAIEAAEQCERLSVPVIEELIPLSKALAQHPKTTSLIMGDETGGGEPLARLLHGKTPPLALLIGPEGGFTPEEITQLSATQFIQKCSLGPRILRADTAAIAGLSVIQSLSGDWVDATPAGS